jgi:ribosome-associated toxin RatA of RatAB toxin-antitoxin module
VTPHRSRRSKLPPIELGEMPEGLPMQTVDEAIVRCQPTVLFEVVRDVKRWPEHLSHYRWVRVHHESTDGGGVVEMAAYRPFGLFNWPTWWLSDMQIIHRPHPAVRFKHTRGITAGMDVIWEFLPHPNGTHVRLVHAWRGPRWPLIGRFAAIAVIGPVFVHGIAQRTLAGLGTVAERSHRRHSAPIQLGHQVR